MNKNEYAKKRGCVYYIAGFIILLHTDIFRSSLSNVHYFEIMKTNGIIFTFFKLMTPTFLIHSLKLHFFLLCSIRSSHTFNTFFQLLTSLKISSKK